MQPSFRFLQNVTWVFLIISMAFFTPSTVSRSEDISLSCGPSTQAINASTSSHFIPNFVQVMESIQTQVSQREWGRDSIINRLPEVYGFAQCYSDLSDLDCKLCFSQGRVKLPRCLPANAARIYLDGCFLRYDNYSFYREEIDPLYDSVNCSTLDGALIDGSLHMEFKKTVTRAIANVTDMVLNNGTFAALAEKSGAVTVYALAQCWNTLDKAGCRRCLMAAGPRLRQCAPASDGSALFTGCFIRYSTERFFHTRDELIAYKHSNAGIVAGIVLSAVSFVVLACFGGYIGYERLSKDKEDRNNLNLVRYANRSNLNFKYEMLEKATDYFSELRKLGQGGAGSVFKGTFPDGRTVAVKRLVYNTRQWADQFFNEVNLISGIQHSNLVRLLGCSIEGPESLLVYEYVPNRSLDQILFIKNTINILSWQQRYNIILGTAEGLAYLHGGSGIKIIHRDIKTGNILLDERLTPKIADFGLARCATAGDSHISTGIAGTLGYMAPEYLIRGQLTEKADVYSFGVLTMEIASGRKNSVFSQGSSSILHSVWKHYKAGTITQTVDAGLKGRFSEKEAANVLQIGLLCTQASAALRPTMPEVVQMLTNRDSRIPSPKQPPFLNASVLGSEDSSDSCMTGISVTKRSITDQKELFQAVASFDTQNSFKTAILGGTNHSTVIEPDELPR